jgi:hypothetical protein
MRQSIFCLWAVMMYLPVAAQMPSNATIYIKAEQSASGQAFEIGIVDMGSQFKLVYRVKDSLSALLYKDPLVETYLNKFKSLTHLSQQSDSLMDLVQKIDSLRQRYTYYSTDSMSIHKKDKPSYAKLVDRILHTPIDSLEQKANNRNRIVLDGTGFVFGLQQNGRTQKAYAHSPTEASHPLLHTLLQNTFALYRQGHPKSSLLQRNYTGGY